MEPSIPNSASETSGAASRPVIVAIAAVLGLALAATIALWTHYGSAVFYEMILAGLAACF